MNPLARMDDAPTVAESLELLKHHRSMDITIEEPLEAFSTRGQIIVRSQYALNGLKHAESILRARKSVKARLEQAASLLPPETTLIVLDAWRSAALQQELYDYLNANLPPSVDRENYVFNPSTIGSIKGYPTDAPPHRTGGAIDVVLGDIYGNALPMGIGYDEMTPLARTSAFEETDNDLSASEAKLYRNRRRTLIYVMTNAGFSNYPEEYWHYDFGNSFWRFYSCIPGKGKFCAIT
jgi:D-alanyl-D-alanine dipeptidase